MTKKRIIKELKNVWEKLDKIQDDPITQHNSDAMWEVGEAMGCISNAIDELESEMLDQFINKNTNKIKRHLKKEGKELGYTKNQLENYYLDTKCFIFAGTKEELEQETNHYFVIAEQGDLVIAETFDGKNYNCI